ncbi:hypothetical protein GGX14DRAFT_569558 [Mycena pura]|uniref:Uncharacterized protein n=1 Tax=Mycena pura TaxID=153505 RepID=A0AAD6V6N6_9AGAR|nr:hypothetical protein GGX14DRAFT_569558 [Mycena pura]
MPIAFPTRLHYDDNDAVSASSSNSLASRASSHGHSPDQQNATFPSPPHPQSHPRQRRSTTRTTRSTTRTRSHPRGNGREHTAHPGNAYVHTVFQGHPCPHAPLPAALNDIRNGAGAGGRRSPRPSVHCGRGRRLRPRRRGRPPARLHRVWLLCQPAPALPMSLLTRALPPGLVPLVPSYSISVTSVPSSSYSTPEDALSDADKETTTTGEGH